MMPPVTVDQVALFASLGVLKHVADPKSSVLALSHVLLEGADGEVLATATDLHCLLSALLPGDGDGSYLLPIKQLAALVEPEDKPKKGKARPTTEVKVYIDPEDAKSRREDYQAMLANWRAHLVKWQAAKDKAEEIAKEKKLETPPSYVEGYGVIGTAPAKPSANAMKARLETPDLKGSLIGLDVNGFPSRPRITWERTTQIDIEEAVDALGWAMSAVSSDEARAQLNSLLIDPEAGLAATDGHRLHKAPFSYVGEPMQVALTSLEHLMRLMKREKTGKVLVSNGGTVRLVSEVNKELPSWAPRLVPYARFDLGIWSLVVKLVDPLEHRFPPYDKVIPAHDRGGQTIVMRASTAKVAATGKRLMKISDGVSAVKVTMSPDSDVSVWECDNPDAAGAKIEVPVEFEQKDITEPFTAGFNVRYLIEAVEGMGETATFSFTEPAAPCRIDGENCRLAIAMPMRL